MSSLFPRPLLHDDSGSDSDDEVPDMSSGDELSDDIEPNSDDDPSVHPPFIEQVRVLRAVIDSPLFVP